MLNRPPPFLQTKKRPSFPKAILGKHAADGEARPLDNEDQEESLMAYGFNVVVGPAKSPTPAAAKAK